MSSVVLAVVGNKADRTADRQVTEDEGRKVAETLGVHLFFETSAKSGSNVNDLFFAVAKEAVSKLPTKPIGDEKLNLNKQQPSNQEGNTCC